MVAEEGLQGLEVGMVIDKQRVKGEKGVGLFGVLLPAHQLQPVCQLVLIH